jgi:CarD family transcriptional regulator
MSQSDINGRVKLSDGGIMFKIGDYAVCPGHGVGQVCDVEEKVVGEQTMSFYILKVLANGMTVMVPTNSKDGIRELVEQTDIDEVYTLLKDHDIKIDNSTWNRRYREYMLKIKTGSLVEIAEVLRALFLLKTKKNLSFGEKKMLDQCRELLAQEISLSGGMESTLVSTGIDACFE